MVQHQCLKDSKRGEVSQWVSRQQKNNLVEMVTLYAAYAYIDKVAVTGSVKKFPLLGHRQPYIPERGSNPSQVYKGLKELARVGLL